MPVVIGSLRGKDTAAVPDRRQRAPRPQRDKERVPSIGTIHGEIVVRKALGEERGQVVILPDCICAQTSHSQAQAEDMLP